jgi:hypothetical protein
MQGGIMVELESVTITAMADGKFQATLKLFNGETATSKGFAGTDEASAWAAKYAAEAENKGADEAHSAEVNAGTAATTQPSTDPEATE